MTTYNTYQEAKIDNPDKEIVTTGHKWDGMEELIGTFEPLSNSEMESHYIADNAWVICNPADHCRMNLQEFFEAGHKLEAGDVYLNNSGKVINVGIGISVKNINYPARFSLIDQSFVLSAKALEENTETQEQKKEREREMAVYDMCSSLDNHAEEARFWAERFYDAGYRKPE